MTETENVKEALAIFCDGVDAAVSALRANLGVPTQKPVKGSVKLPFDPSKIQWQKRQGGKGEFELSEDFNSLDHKALLKFLSEHAGGCINSEGWFYWVFKNGSTLGRTQKKPQKEAPAKHE
jgi:hypothetical protein